MATSCQTLVDRARRYVRDLPLEQQPISGSLTNSQTSVTVGSTANFQTNDPFEIDSEIFVVTTVTNATTLAVTRGAFGSTAVTHNAGATLLRRPNFYTIEYVDAVNQGMWACFPQIYKEVVDESVSLTANTWEFTIPNMPSPAIPIPFIAELQVQAASTIPFQKIRSWDLIRGATPKIKFRRASFNGDLLRIRGYGPFPALTATTDSLDTLFPQRCEYLLSLYAAASLLESGEAGRVRSDRGMNDDREQANRTGSSLAVGAQLMNRFYVELARNAMPPMPKPVKSVI